MAANFQPHMGGPGQMMPGRPQPQRPPQNGQQPANATTQIQQVIFQTVSSQTGQLSGWQSNMLIQERIGLIFNIIGNLRLASQNTPTPPGLNKMIEIGIKFEKEIFHSSPDKASYKRAVDAKLEQLLERRHQNQAGLQQTINQQAQAQAQAQQQQVQQQMMMNQQNGMQGQAPRPQPSQQGFQHLQHQMQASPLPGQQPQNMGMGMGMANDALPPNMTPNQQQQQFQMPMQQPQQQNGPPMSVQDNAMLTELAHRLMTQAPIDEKNSIRARLKSTMDPQMFATYTQRGQDPLIMYYRNQALQRLREDKRTRMQVAQAQHMAMSQGQNLSNGAPLMQHQRSMNPSPLNGQTQPPTSMGGNGEFGGFPGNMNSITNQQQKGIDAQESGQVVVPASGAQRNVTPQPGVMPGQQMNNPNNRTAQQQHMLNVQQMGMQQQRMQQQQQQQQQTRLNVQNKVQMNLQGQPGGMSNGPMPPQQSPAMATLNTPLRTPSQMGHNEPPQANMNPSFGQPIGDPRFAANQRNMGPGNPMNPAGINPQMFASLSQQQQQEVLGMPPDKLNEVMNKWNESRAQMNAANMQAGRPPVSMQGNNQARPGQPQAFNSQNAANQFNMGGPRPPQGQMTAAMTPQQQILLQQQIARLRDNPLQQQRNGAPPINMQAEQRMLAQMDNMDFPPSLSSHAHMPQGAPPNIKKWGALKLWTQQNPNMGPEQVEAVKSLQKMHWTQLMRQRVAAQNPRGMPPGAQGGQGAMPMNPAGMAPVAPMGQAPMQLQNGMNIPGAGQFRQPTQADINAARNHPSGRMLQLSDDHIRQFLMKQFQQQAASMHMQNMQMQQMSQMNAQQPRPGQPQPNPNARAPNQATPAQTTKPIVPEPNSAANTQNANRANRPQPNPRSAQNSSPAQPPNKLKRASSDDVVEVPNPNAQQATRSTPQQTSIQKQPSQQGRQLLTPAQVAALDPEARQKYELSLKISAQQARDKADAEKLKVLQQESQVAKVADIPMDQETKNLMVKVLREIQPIFGNMSRAIIKWYQIARDDGRSKAFFRLKSRLAQQFRDDAMTQPKDIFSMYPKDVEQAKALLVSMIKDLTDKYPAMAKGRPTQSQAPAAKAPSQSVAAPPVQLSAANLQQQQQQLNKMHQRSNSRSSHAPAAPTSSQPPFQFGAGSPPPDGVPAYPAMGKPPVTRETLVFPAKKRQKQENKPTSASNASPNLTKTTSPEVKRQDIKQQQKPLFSCLDPECDRHNVGFESEDALRAHTQEEHYIENPAFYAQQNLAAALGLDPQGKPLVGQDNMGAHTATKMSTSGSKQGQTPNIKGENTPAATPMNRQVSMNRQNSAAGTRPGAPSKATSSKDAVKTPTSQRDASKQRPTQPPKEVVVEDPWANATIDPHDLYQAFKPFESGAGGAISDMNVYRSITPNDTPESSKDGLSEPNSDISDGVGLDISLDIFDDTWMPFGPSETTFLDMNNFNVAANDTNMDSMAFLDEEPPATNFASWDDMVDASAFDAPFKFDNSFYMMNTD
ncbi:hypothetical protein LSUE1_G007102 [Lachnellula suecica]|uniref:Mediator complex subunit 15 KIX domain-containing protein n=1 Tax=Lachnellula suecica TaxID=602035 RepID=A0A8T9C2X5_9HELO|nr:hypothetical protein LSUE1_G007102 [Lachnellula suecica]